MNVEELIDFLKQQPQKALVASTLFSEQRLLYASEIKVVQLCKPREDGWIQNERPDKEAQTYLLFPGN